MSNPRRQYLLPGMTLAAAALGWATAAHADPFVRLTPAPLSDRALDSLRGGFDNGQLQASFCIERSTTINGALVVSQSIHIADLSRVSSEQASQLHSLLGGVTLVRNGPGNAFAPTAANALGGALVVQNSLDGQTIKSLTVIDATTNSLGALQTLNAAGALRNALIAPLVPRP